jgi:FdhE protein
VIEPHAPAPGDAPPLRLPEPGRLFELRATRLLALAASHGVPDWLRLLARIAEGQAVAVRELRPARPPPRGGRPLDHGALPRDDAWRRMLAVILAASRGPGLPAATEETLRRLAAAGPVELEALADAVLSGAVPPAQVAAAPFVGAALQAWLASLAAGLDPAAAPPAAEGACPVCGGPPVAARIRKGDRLRYVVCAFCASEWNVPRVHCVACDTSAGPAYFHVDAERGVKAEACPTCRAYVKLFDEEQRPGCEPTADDAATLTLDLLVAEEGYQRAGPNLYVGW